MTPAVEKLLAVRAAADCLADRKAVSEAYDRLAAGIARDFAGANPLLLAVVVGGIIPAAEIAQRLDFPLEMDYLHATRYRGATVGGGLVWKRQPEPARIAGRHVVVIDDDGENRFAVETLCRQWGCHVLGAASAAAALGQLERHLRSPDLIITDFRLGQAATGAEAIVGIRAMAEEAVPAIIVTGDMAVREADASGCAPCALLHKPINAEQLWTAAERVLSAPRTEPAGHAP